MNIKELETEAITLLINELQSELKSRVKKEKENFLNTIKAKADFFGVSVEDLMIEASRSKKRKAGKLERFSLNIKTPIIKRKLGRVKDVNQTG